MTDVKNRQTCHSESEHATRNNGRTREAREANVSFFCHIFNSATLFVEEKAKQVSKTYSKVCYAELECRFG